jgi:uncharacterized membrane protein YgdD (TMEM256/DUF423 family)
MNAKSGIVYGSLLLALGVIIGAFGAHGLEKMVEASKLATFETGVRYHFYHAFAILLASIIALVKPQMNIAKPILFFSIGILLFSFGCYSYVVTGIKPIAMIVPFGGVSFIVGWIMLAMNARKLN